MCPTFSSGKRCFECSSFASPCYSAGSYLTRLDIRTGSRAKDTRAQENAGEDNCQVSEAHRGRNAAKSVQHRPFAGFARLTSRSSNLATLPTSPATQVRGAFHYFVFCLFVVAFCTSSFRSGDRRSPRTPQPIPSPAAQPRPSTPPNLPKSVTPSSALLRPTPRRRSPSMAITPRSLRSATATLILVRP